ncbi:iron-uptake system-binding protein, partial [Butyricicoccus sp. 1XD8-22]
MKNYWKYGAAALLTLSLAACNTSEEGSSTTGEKPVQTSEEKPVETQQEQAKEITINYLGTDYTFENPVENIVTASFE